MRVLLVTMLAAAALAPAAAAQDKVFEGPVPKADCGPGSRPEPALQGEVPAANRESGDSLKGYSCNLEIVGNAPGERGSRQHTWYGDGAYYDSNHVSHIDTYVLDVSVPAKPKAPTGLA